MKIDPIDTHEFIRSVRPALEEADAQALASAVLTRWKPAQLCQLLHHGDNEVRKLVCVTLGLIGDDRVVSCLAHTLRDDDPQVNEMAEHALWSIWFRGGTDAAQRMFRQGLEAMEHADLPRAVEKLNKACGLDPTFAEAHNQRSLCHYMTERWHDSLDAAGEAVAQMPYHFGALAQMGHAYVQIGEMDAAADCYRQALDINPRIHAVALALGRLHRGSLVREAM